jgi:hypothetical protein
MKALVSGYIERISSIVFDDYHDEITALIGKQHGVYALYKKNRLYYVGLAKDLRGRVKEHLKDKHAHKWDSFSLYLIHQVEHLKELEALVLHIAAPKGNIQTGKFSTSKNLLPGLKQLMESRDKRKREWILTGTKQQRPPKHQRQKLLARKPRAPALAGFLPSNTMLRATYKKQSYEAVVDEVGRIILLLLARLFEMEKLPTVGYFGSTKMNRVIGL